MYFKDTTVCAGEVSRCEIEDNNEHDKYAMTVNQRLYELLIHEKCQSKNVIVA